MFCVRNHWINRNSLTNRLTIKYVITFSIMALMLSVCVYGLAYQSLIMNYTDELIESSESVLPIIENRLTDPQYSSVSRALIEDIGIASDMTLLYLPNDSEDAFIAGALDVVPSDIPDCIDRCIQFRRPDGQWLLAYGRNIYSGSKHVGILLLMLSLNWVAEYLNKLLLLLLGLNVLGIFISITVGRFAVKKMIAPIANMIRHANAIGVDSLNERLEVPEIDDELRLLAVTVNRMLDRVEQAYNRQSRFTGDASHELRTPLAIIQGNIDLLERWGKDEPDTRDKCIHAISKQLDYINRLVEDLLFLTRSDNSVLMIERTEFDLNQFLQNILLDMHEIDQHHNYSCSFRGEQKIHGDPALMRQLLMILLNNSMRYTPKDGSISIDAANDGRSIHICVVDSGCGVPEDQLDKIFERFYRVDKARSRATGGNGLGLAIAQTIVQLLNGKIHAECRTNEGLRIIIELPVNDGSC